METSALYHRPESEYAYLYKDGHFHVRLRTKTGDVEEVELLSGDPYTLHSERWHHNGQSMRKVASTNIHDYWEIDTYEPTHRMSYGFHVIGKDGVEVFYSDQGVYPYHESYLTEANFYFRIPYIHSIDAFKAPDWVTKTIWYQIFPERFANGDKSNDPEGTLAWGSKEHPSRDDFFGGDLQGVLDNFDYLEELGINGIYFCPIFKATSNHKYDTIDYEEVDEAFGDKALFKAVVDEAHRRGIRIMIDAVFNHLGMDSPQWQDVLKNQENSQYRDWFHIHDFPVKSFAELTVEELEDVGGANYDTFAFTAHMPKLNTANHEVQEYLLGIAKYWIREFDIDAWRLDVANEVDHNFWKRFKKETTAIKEDIYILGEIWHSSPNWLKGDEFHAVMNYAFNDNIKNYFFNKLTSASRMVSGLNSQLMLYRKQTTEVAFNLLDSHDTARLLTKAGGDSDLAKTALTFMFAQIGSPCIYYGTEIGMTGFDDPDCRKCMIWDKKEQDLSMLEFTKELIAFRKEYQEFITYGEVIWHDVRDDEQVVGFKRILGDEELVFYFNQDEESFELDGLPERSLSIFSQGAIRDGNTVSIEQNGFYIYKSVLVDAHKKDKIAAKRARARRRFNPTTLDSIKEGNTDPIEV
ncbi:glycoside hydrolase family 13 protein [Lacticigenium naphthae]|uniref:glycoside hydrolase family 13 protein n=1 Tax=Lacticigenium naphthae TaxID=515351 RepID=UPI0004245847|nr:glycoside hydrolase family 13 protein [Lacticigenium naphthae]